MIDRIRIDGVIYAITPTTAPSLGDRVVTVDGVTYVIGEPIVEAEEQQQTGDIERISVDGVDYDILREKLRAFAENGVTKILWSNDSAPLSNMNDFTTAGVYELSGEHTRNNDNLPIANTGSGHTFNARLTVLDSSISGSGNADDKCITQLLAFSNRLGQGEVYIRTGKGDSTDDLTWGSWATLQRNVNVGSLSYYTLDQNDDTGNPLNTLIDNGIYNGVLNHAWGGTDTRTDTETFTLIVINDYFTSPYERHVSQFKYSVLKDIGTVIFEYRVGVGNDTIVWSDWENLGGSYTLPIATSDTLGGIKSSVAQSDTPMGTEYGVRVFDDGKAYVLIPHPADVVAKGNTGAVTSGAVYDAIATAITNTINTPV